MSLWIYWHQCSWSYVDRLFLMAVPDKVIGWFSNRTGTSVDDDARKSSFPRTFPSSNDVPVLLLNQPITFNLKTPLCKTITSYFNRITKLWNFVCSLESSSSFSSTQSFKQFVYSYFEKGCGKNVHATIPKSNTGYDFLSMYCSSHLSCGTYLCCFALALADIRPWPLVPFFENSLKNSELKTTHNTIRDCRVHFFRQLFSK